jgi:TonB family protein
MTAAALAADVLVVSAQIACVTAVAGVLALVVRIDAATVRYQYWRALLVFCLVLPWVQRRQAVGSPVEAFTTFMFSSTAVGFAQPAGVSARPAIPWVEVVLWIVLAGIAIRLARVAYGSLSLRRVGRSGQPSSANIEQNELQVALGTNAEIRYVPHGQPVTCGVWRPVVLLPERLKAQTAEIQRAVLVHELLHVKRRDWLWVMGEELLRAVFWFHPAVWWLIARVRTSREEVVDELAVCATGQRRVYLEALLAFADAAPFAPSAAFARRSHLFRRMTLISKEAVMSSRRIAVSCAILVLGVVAGSWYAVHAFPMAQTSVAATEPGPVERSAKPITPENPIPRRTYSVAPKYPEGNSGVVAVTLRITINALGRVDEARAFGAIVGGRGAVTAPSSDAFVKAAIGAVRQWVYEPPVDAPVSFDVGFVFTPGSETRTISYGGPVYMPSVKDAPLEERPRDSGVALPPPPPPPPPPPAPWVRDGVTLGTPVRVGGGVAPPTKVKDVKAVYPQVAQAAKVQGVVVLEAVIGPEGRVDQLRVLRGIPLLDQAAMDAVKEWEFTPTMMNGVAVPVIVAITVNFTLK